MTPNRRTVLRTGLAGLSFALWPRAAAAAGYRPLADGKILDTAQRLSRQYAGQLRHRDHVAIVNYSAPSWQPRLHLVDLKQQEVASYLVAHGRGSDPDHTGWLQDFSNKVGSKASSRGAYVTVEQYTGKYGRSIRLEGVDAENSNAYRRAIVIHPAWYVGDDMLRKYGKLGRSEGCFALSSSDIGDALDRLGPGRLVYAGKL